MSADMTSQASLSPGLPSVGRLAPRLRQRNDLRRESKHGPSRLACASSRPEHPRNNAPASTRRQADPPNAHGPPDHISSSRAMLRSLPPTPQPQPQPQPQRSSRHGGDNGLAPFDGSSETAGETRRFSFFDFPPEIRNMIYHCSLHRPDCAGLYRGYYRQAAALPRAQRWHRAHLRTPTILLLCRRITDESMPVLRAQWFVIDRLPPCMPPTPDGKGGFLRMSNFIGRETLQRLDYIDLRVGLGEGPLGSGWIWNRVLDELLGILSERNALVHFRLLIRRCNQEDSPPVWTTEMAEEAQIRRVCV
ncbi:hypothetical protein FJTKL_01668 [Diaporthe vaccinii]|uniref:F-box domain-containing protein n=1 Tax=Diaporthe vaccinii TaxID=105482 RepID=A0ABR4E000_9PEZI